MEPLDEEVMGGGGGGGDGDGGGAPKDHTHIVKGKRTKRQRVQSPIPFSIAAHSSSGDNSNTPYYNNNNNNTASSPATTTTSAELFLESATEEEEDMANCLILLAQGHSREQSNWNNKPIDDHEGTGSKFTSKRFLETPSTGNGKVGMYVYQCKTCNRTFPSFQALGGHRASHKKPKQAAAAAAEERRLMMTLLSDDEDDHQPLKNNHVPNSSSLSLQLVSNINRPYNLCGNSISKSSSKVHECSICGAEFTSGQALGGHMRRHRGGGGSGGGGPIGGGGGGGSTNATLSLISPTGLDHQSDDHHQEGKRVRNNDNNNDNNNNNNNNGLSLDLDLNLPAPEDDHHNRDSMFNFASKQQQQQQQQQSPLVLSTAPTLVDCHY